MKIEKNELVFIYNSTDNKDKEALIYAKSLNGYELRSIDITNENITPTQLKFVADQVEKNIPQLMINNNHDGEKGRDLNSNEMLNWLTKNLDNLKTPIALWHDGGKILKDNYSLVNKGLRLNKT